MRSLTVARGALRAAASRGRIPRESERLGSAPWVRNHSTSDVCESMCLDSINFLDGGKIYVRGLRYLNIEAPVVPLELISQP